MDNNPQSTARRIFTAALKGADDGGDRHQVWAPGRDVGKDTPVWGRTPGVECQWGAGEGSGRTDGPTGINVMDL